MAHLIAWFAHLNWFTVLYVQPDRQKKANLLLIFSVGTILLRQINYLFAAMIKVLIPTIFRLFCFVLLIFFSILYLWLEKKKKKAGNKHPFQICFLKLDLLDTGLWQWSHYISEDLPPKKKKCVCVGGGGEECFTFRKRCAFPCESRNQMEQWWYLNGY